MPKLNVLRAKYATNIYFLSLPARYQDVVLYWDLKEPLDESLDLQLCVEIMMGL